MPETPQTHSYALPQGFRLGDYLIDRTLGQGGFGITYLAHDVDSGEQVVIKENLNPEFAFRDPSSRKVFPLDTSARGMGDYEWALENFYNEARLLATLNHPGIVKVLRAFHALGTAYYVMPHVGGVTLGQWAVKHPLPTPQKVLSLLDSILSALHYLHSHNILHRDVKPANIIMAEDGEPILIDFGTARQIISEHSATKIGSPGYTPYEQFQTHGKTGQWTDLYALGATMYHLLTGGEPVDCKTRMGEDGDTLIPLRAQPALVKRYGKPLLASIDKAMRVSRRRRWQSAEEWRRELARIRNKHTSKKALAAALILLSAGAGIGGYLYFGERQEAPAAPVVEEPAPTQPSRDNSDNRLLEAATGGTVQDAQAALDAGADIHAQDSQGRTALHMAAGRGDMEMADFLLEHDALFNAKDSSGNTPADAAKANSHAALYVFLLKKAAENADAKTQYHLALMFSNGDGVEKDDTEAAVWLRKAADQGLAEAQNNLGTCYALGQGVPQNDKEALMWYRKAADEENAEAQFNLGIFYAFGKGVPKDPVEAVKWYRKAADQGFAQAQFNLGVCYLGGEGVDPNPTEATGWFRKAADQGFAQAQFNLGMCYAIGHGVPQSGKEAVEWYRKAADQGHAGAQNNLGECYLNGKGVNPNPTEAAGWYRKAAEQGNAYAQTNLGECYENGKGVPKDPNEAVEWYRKAADQGFAEAQFNLGRCYEDGRGVPQDDAEAMKWYRKASAQGHEAARQKLPR